MKFPTSKKINQESNQCMSNYSLTKSSHCENDTSSYAHN